MRSFVNRVDRYCYKHPDFGIPRLMIYVVFGTAAVFLLSLFDRSGVFVSYLTFSPAHILKGQIWRLFTFIFIPVSTNPLTFALSLYFYYFIGSTIEATWGAGKFTIYYGCGVLFSILYGVILVIISMLVPRFALYSYASFDATYLNLSLFFAFAAMYPDTRVLLFFIIPIKIKWLALVDAIFFVISIILNPFPVNLLPIVAIGNFLLFCSADLLDYIKPIRASKTKQAQNFRRQAQQIKYEEAHKEYRHKCSVCGRTDTDYPNLEFRYCSKCNGFHCFCEDHINNHVHFQ